MIEGPSREALELIEVEYDELPSVMDCEGALASGATLIHEEQYGA